MPTRSNRHWYILALITILGACLRYWGVRFGFPGRYRPDEEYLVGHGMSFLSGQLNPHFYLYPTFYMYFIGAVYWISAHVGHWIGLFGPAVEGFQGYVNGNNAVPAHYIGRVTTATIGTFTILATFRFGRVAFGKLEGFLAALLVATSVLHVRESHYVTTDVAMTFFVVLALTSMVLITTRGYWRDFICAGIFTGLAVSTKYPALALGFPLGISIIFRTIIARKERWYLKFPTWCVVSGLCVALAFAATSPYFIIDFASVVKDFDYQKGFVKDGLPGVGIPYGFPWLFGYGFWWGVTPGLMAIGFLGMGYAIYKSIRLKPEYAATLPAIVFIIGLGSALVASKWVFVRYVLPCVPIFAIFAAHFAAVCSRSLPSKSLGVVIAISIISIAGTTSLTRAWNLDRMLAAVDTRNLAREWIFQNIPKNSPIATYAYFFYAKPEPLPGYHFVDFAKLLPPTDPNFAKDSPKFILVDKHPISYFSPTPPQTAADYIRQYATLRAVFTPFIEGKEGDAVFDKEDAFYTPIAGFEAVDKSGPILEIYEVK